MNEIAIRIARATQEKSVAADALQQFALTALLAGLAGGDARFVRNHFVAGLGQIDDKFPPKFAYRVTPGQLAFLDFVQLFLEPSREGDVEDVVEAFHQQDAHSLAQHRRREAPLVLAHILALHNCRNNRSY